MENTKLNIALLAGGNSSEREIALGSAAQVAEAFDHQRYNVWLIDVHHRNFTYRNEGKEYGVDLNDFSLTVEDQKVVFDYAFVMIHGTPGEDGHIQGYLEMMGVPFSSCDMTSSVITFDKISTKRAVAHTGVNLAKGMLIGAEDWIAPDMIVAELGLPLFVKPNASGSSCGVTKVKSAEEVLPAIMAAFEESDEVLVEEFIAGREFACGVMATEEQFYRFPVTEVVAKNEFFDYEAKYTAGMSDEITPAQISPELTTTLQDYAEAAYKACRCRGLARVDFIVTPEGEPYMIEINAIPGMSAGSIVPKQIKAAGMTMTEVLNLIIDNTL
ncbi:MAG: D-alanine--D-alanine ligase [Rikenellaceae bacterium]|nr:D-alanine--D-alanine ligase [Rikenellaceae bacterium]